MVAQFVVGGIFSGQRNMVDNFWPNLLINDIIRYACE